MSRRNLNFRIDQINVPLRQRDFRRSRYRIRFPYTQATVAVRADKLLTVNDVYCTDPQKCYLCGYYATKPPTAHDRDSCTAQTGLPFLAE